MSRTMWLLAAAVVAALLAGPVAAAPSLDIQKPPVVPVPSNTGPTQDPHAEQGQWFQDEHSGDKVVCTHEFYDNVQQPAEKGGWAGHYAIVGHVLNIRYDGITQNIIAFDINATITNDVPDYEGWRPGDNSHGESLQTSDQYVGDLLQTKLTADFAVPPSSAGLLPGTIGPYRDASPHIIALNHDFLAWYCWTPDNGDPDKQPNGSYYVPAWDFLDIPQGQSYVRVLMFTVEAPGLSPDDPRYAAIEESYYDEQDILLNRTSSLKISTWQDDPTIDYGIPYPHLDGAMPLRSSDCSVFHNIVHEPEWIEGGLSLDVRKPPVAPLGSWTGPPQDFDAVQGQWFLRFDGTEEVRSHEYYDPTWPASLPAKSAAKKTDKKSAKSTLKAPAKAAAKGVGSAIYGVVTNVRYVAGSTNIAAFDIDATITNLTPWPY
ncbi:MAG: hypothetical protein JXL80_04510, partial [Planctomycetes bacterium]|nr:hypothetical protein [Planctomycetota bacterium]